MKLPPALRRLSAHLRNYPDTLIVMIAFATFGSTLVVQSARYLNTPSYANLLDIASPQLWGVIYLAVVLGLALSIRYSGIRPVVVIAHTAAIALDLGWLGAFVVRYLSDSGTTIVNIVSWGVFLALLFRSVLLLDDASTTRTRPGARIQ